MTRSGVLVYGGGEIRLLRGGGSEVLCPDGIDWPRREWPVQTDPISSVIAVDVASVQDQGMRKTQQDRIWVRARRKRPEITAIVTDGHGPLGELASRVSAREFHKNALLNVSLGQLPVAERLRQAVGKADAETCRLIFSAAAREVSRIEGKKESDFDSGTTLLALVLVEGRYFLVHVGDSRAYLLRRSGRPVVQLLTEDQRWPGGDYHFGWAMHSALGHPFLRKRLSQTSKDGVWPEKGIYPRPMITPLDNILPGDILVLGSDGLHAGPEGSTADLLKDCLLGEGDIRTRLNRLMTRQHRGQGDNVSVVVVEARGVQSVARSTSPTLP